MSNRIEVRCFCSKRPLLGLAGRDEEGKLFVHVRVFKQKRLYADVVIHEGRVSLCCRECFRWHEVIIRADLEMAEVPRPEVLEPV